MQNKKLIPLIAVVLALTGCIFAPGDSSNWDDDRSNGNATVGQQLIDLDRARDAGVLTDAEYERTKAKILESVD